MNAAGKLAGFAVVLGVALGGGAAVGGAVGPLDTGGDDGGMAQHEGGAGGAADTGTDAGHAEGRTGDSESTGHTGGEHDEAADTASAAGEAADGAASDEDAAVPGGVLVSHAGYTLAAEHTTLDGAAGTPLRFRITGPDGATVRDFETVHERDLHLIVVDRDLRTYAHLHPTRAADGTWEASLPELAPGAYRAFADFTVAGGPALTLGTDLSVPGPSTPAPLPRPATTATVGGYEVALDGAPDAGGEAEVALTVTRAGRPVTDLEPYLGAAGHLVAIREGDLAYLHVHPLDEATGRDGTVRFAVEVPSPGRYRLFFDFAHEGEVRTAAFTVNVPAAAGGEPVGAHDHDAQAEEQR
ncbi:MAG TPA: heavy-metal-associated domain-containing protein [Acidimicrobiales bacterium]